MAPPMIQLYHNSKVHSNRLSIKVSYTRYHSLILSSENFPDNLEIDALSEDGVIMGIHHKVYPIYGVQFHPEAVLTEYGYELLGNFIQLCKGWNRNNENKNR